MLRFYSSVTIENGERGYAIHLDGRPVRTPARTMLMVPQHKLAQALAGEWAAQDEVIHLHSMPINRLANAAIDLASPAPKAFAAPLIAYGASDLLCYRAPEAELAAQQAQAWNPILAWAEGEYGIEFKLATGIVHVAQPQRTLATLRDAVNRLDAFQLAALAPLVTISGSLVIALALTSRAIDADTGWAAATLDELWQEQRWGADTDAVATRALKQGEWLAAARFLDLLEPLEP